MLLILFSLSFSTIVINLIPNNVPRSSNLTDKKDTVIPKPKLSGNNINITSPENMTYLEGMDGFYPGTFDFDSDKNGNLPRDWVDDSGSGCGGVITSQKGSHQKILNISDNDGSNIASLSQIFTGNQQTGTMEFWALSEMNSKVIEFMIDDDTGNHPIRIFFKNSSNFAYYNGSTFENTASYALNTWYHFRIVFDCINNNYSLLIRTPSSTLVNKKDIDFYQIDDGNGLSAFVIQTNETETGAMAFLDAVSYSWDSDYSLNQNFNIGFLITYTNNTYLENVKYSLDGLSNITIYGNTTIPLPSFDSHSIEIFGDDGLGTEYESDIVYFNIRALALVTPENITYNNYMEGYYYSTYGFENQVNGLFGDAIDFLSFATISGGETSIKNDYLKHNKVLLFKDTDTLTEYRAKHTFPNNKTSGTIEFWWLFSDTYNDWLDIYFEKEDTDAFKISAFDNFYYDSEDNQLISYYEERWYHHKIVFDCSAGMNGQYSWYIDGGLVVENQEFSTNLNEIDNIHFIGHIGREVEAYFDAFSFSWDTNYAIGDNLEEDLFLSFKTRDDYTWTGFQYSLDGQSAVTCQQNQTIPFTSEGSHRIVVNGLTSGPTYQSNTVYFNINMSRQIELIYPLNTTYTDPMYGYYVSTYGFENDKNEYYPEAWSTTASKDCSLTVSSSKDGHNKILNLTDFGGSTAFVETINTFDSGQNNGTVEFWLYIEDNNDYPVNISLTEANNKENGLIFTIGNGDGYQAGFYYHNGTEYIKIADNFIDQWYHIKLKFDIDENWTLWINNIQYGNGYNFSGNPLALEQMVISTFPAAANYRIYFDAIGYSWDPLYNVGENLKTGLLVGFDINFNADWIGLSLDGQPNRTIYGNTTIHFPAVGTHSVQVYANDSSGRITASVLRYFTIVDYIDPVIEGMEWMPILEQLSVFSLKWNITEINDGNYIIERNGTEVDSDTFIHWINVSITVNTTEVGLWNYTIFAYDPSGNTDNHTVIVFIQDTVNPSIEGPPSSMTLDQLSTYIFNWNITEYNNGTYELWRNSTSLDSGDFFNWVNFSYFANTTTVGDWNYSLIVHDPSGNNDIHTTILTIVDNIYPVIEGIEGIKLFEANGTNQFLRWNITEYNNGTFTIKRNGTIVDSGNFKNWVNVSIEVNSTKVGYWNYTIIVADPSNNNASHEVIIQIVDLDLTNPVIEGPPIEIYLQIGSSYTLQWNVTEINNGTYIILKNSTSDATDTFKHHVNITIAADTTILGYWNYTLIVSDPSNNNATFTLFVYIYNDNLTLIQPNTQTIFDEQSTIGLILNVTLSEIGFINYSRSSILYPGLLNMLSDNDALYYFFLEVFDIDYAVNDSILVSITIRIYYNPSTVSDENSLRIFRNEYPDGANSWIRITTGITLNKTENYLEFTTNSLSYFSIAEYNPETFTEDDDDGDKKLSDEEGLDMVLIIIIGVVVAGAIVALVVVKSKSKGDEREKEAAEAAQKAEQKELKEEEAVIQRKEIVIKQKIENCREHNGPIEGDVYTCPNCNAKYCMQCANNLIEASQGCRDCDNEIEPIVEIETYKEDKTDYSALSENDRYNFLIKDTTSLMKIWLMDSGKNMMIYDETFDKSLLTTNKYDLLLQTVLVEDYPNGEIIEKLYKYGEKNLNLLFHQMDTVLMILVSTVRIKAQYHKFLKNTLNFISANIEEIRDFPSKIKDILDRGCYLFMARDYSILPPQIDMTLGQIFKKSHEIDIVKSEILRIPEDTFSQFLELYGRLTEEMRQIKEKRGDI